MVDEANDGSEFKFSQYIVFDHKVHQYSPDEIAGRLEPHVGRRLEFTQIGDGQRSSLIGILTKEELRYCLDSGMHRDDLSAQLTEAKDFMTGRDILYTLIEIDRTDLYLQAQFENQMRERGGLN